MKGAGEQDMRPAPSDHGTGAQAIRDFDQQADEAAAPAELGDLLRTLRDLAVYHPAAPALLITRLYDPGATVRQLASVVRLSKSRVAQILARVDSGNAQFRRILAGNRRIASEGQRRRWTNAP